MTGRLIVFDVDGTILDSMGFFESVLEKYSHDNGLPKPCIETIKKGYGDPAAHDFKWGVSREEQLRHFEQAWQFCDRLSVSSDYAPVLFHGVENALRHLKDAGHTLAIVTSKCEAPLYYFLNYHSIGGLFSALRCREDIKRRGEQEKPAPDMLRGVMRELGFTPQDTVMVGDTMMDIEMGRMAGVYTIGVTWGAQPVDMLRLAGADLIIDTDFSDVVRAVESKL
jgi:phosphoglycolate phosphatase